jgi:hypothetical protein
VNPTKVKVIEKLQPPRTRKEIHKLTGMIAALNQLISKLDERDMSFSKLLLKTDWFQWDDQTAAAFIQLKQYLKYLPTLVPPLGWFLIGLGLKTDSNGLWVVWIQNHSDGFYQFGLKTDGDRFLPVWPQNLL